MDDFNKSTLNFCQLVCVFIFFLGIRGAFAEDYLGKTYLIELKQGSELSDKVNFYTVGGFETSGGSFISYAPWYTNQWTDARVTFMTHLTQQFGFLWGFSTGEHGEKYRIDPSLKVGFVFFDQFSPRASLSLKFTTILGGLLHESPCTADYGEIGGVQTVNCRYAASPIPPQETLAYLFNDRPYNQTTLYLEYKYFF
jgi:hypothetical protein